MIGFIAADVFALTSSSNLNHSYMTPDPASDDTIEMAIKGWGIFYITPAESTTVAPMWHLVHAFVVVAIGLAGAIVFREGYRGFIKEWRSDDGI